MNDISLSQVLKKFEGVMIVYDDFHVHEQDAVIEEETTAAISYQSSLHQ